MKWKERWVHKCCMSFMFGCQGAGGGIVVSLAMRRRRKDCVKGTDSAGGLSVQLGTGDVWLLGREDCEKRSPVGARISMCTRPLHFKGKHQIWNVAALRFACVCEIQAQSSPSLWRESNKGANQERHQRACPELLGRGEPASGSVNSALCAEATARGLLGTQRALLITFLLLLLKPPSGQQTSANELAALFLNCESLAVQWLQLQVLTPYWGENRLSVFIHELP